MIPFPVYKNIHFIGIFMVLLALGGLLLHSIIGGTRVHPWRKPIAITHGVGIFLIVLGGFGMLARLGIFWSWPGWVAGKVLIWAILGALIALISRKPALAKPLWWITIALAALAAYLGGSKPF